MVVVDAQVQGLGGTQAPQSRAVNLFNEEINSSPCRPTWLQVTERAHCTEVTLSCSCLDQRTRALIKWLGLNIAYAFQVYVKSFKSV